MILPVKDEQWLLSTKPSYSSLESEATERLQGDIPTSRNGASLCIAGKMKYFETDRASISLVRYFTIKKGLLVSFDENKIWWAIPPVIADPAYPLRIGIDAFSDTVTLKE